MVSSTTGPAELRPALVDLRDLLVERRADLTRTVVAQAVASAPPGGGVPEEDLEQMIHGFLELLIAGAEGRTEVRAFYVETVIPGLRDAGGTVSQVVGPTAKTLLTVSTELALALPERSRKEALAWLCTYLSEYLGAIAAVWEVA